MLLRPFVLALALTLGAAIAGCGGGGPYGYARTYSALGEENPYLSRASETSYEEVRRTRPEEQGFITWFGVVRAIESEGGRTRLALSLRAHQDRHLCEGPGDDTCRVTVSEREIGTFSALLDVRAADLAEGPTRLQIGSLVRIYGTATADTDATGGPVIAVEWYRHWPPHYYVTTRAASSNAPVKALAAIAALVALSSIAGCAGGAPPYASCGGEIGCAAGRCTELLYTRTDGTEGGGAFCSDDCVTDADCAALDGSVDAVCVTLDRDSPTRYFCAARCSEPSDCFTGLSCTATEDASLGSLCLP